MRSASWSRNLRTSWILYWAIRSTWIVDIPAQGAERSHDGFIIRRNAIETGVNVLTALDTARALVTSLENRAKDLTLIDIATVKNAKIFKDAAETEHISFVLQHPFVVW